MKSSWSVWGCALLASTGHAADLWSVYRDAVSHDAVLAAATAQRDADQEKRIQARAGLLPQIGLQANTAWNQADMTPAGGAPFAQNYNSHSYGIQLTQPVLRLANWVQAEQGDVQAAMANVQWAAARQDLALRVTQAYFSVLYAQDALSAVSALRQASLAQSRAAQAAFDKGVVTVTDVHESAARLDLAQAQELAAQQQLALAQANLSMLTGQPVGTLTPAPDTVVLKAPMPADLSHWTAAAETGSLGVQWRELAKTLSDLNRQRMSAGHWPSVDLQASRGLQRYPMVSVEKAAVTTVGLQLTVPLYAGGAMSSQVREATSLQLRAQADLDDAKRGATLQAQQAWVNVSSGLAQIKALEASRRSSQTALASNELGYQVGVRINVDVLNAQAQLADTLQKLSKARYDTLQAQLQLKAAVGGLAEADIEALSRMLQP